MQMASRFTDPDDIKLLLECCNQLGINPASIQPENPHLHAGKVAESIQMAASALDPVRGATWAQGAGKTASLASVSAMMGIGEITKDVHQDLMATDPDYVKDVAAESRNREREMLEKMTKEADALHLHNLEVQHGKEGAQRELRYEKEREAAQANGESPVSFKRGQF